MRETSVQHNEHEVPAEIGTTTSVVWLLLSVMLFALAFLPLISQ